MKRWHFWHLSACPDQQWVVNWLLQKIWLWNYWDQEELLWKDRVLRCARAAKIPQNPFWLECRCEEDRQLEQITNELSPICLSPNKKEAHDFHTLSLKTFSTSYSCFSSFYFLPLFLKVLIFLRTFKINHLWIVLVLLFWGGGLIVGRRRYRSV